MITERQFDTGDVTINYAEGPANGPPLVLLHGFTARWQSYQPVILALAEHWHIFAPDYRGHGKSGRTPGHYCARDYEPDIDAFLRTVVPAPAVILGHSMGAAVGLAVVTSAPQHVRALIFADGPYDLDHHCRIMDTQETRAFFTLQQSLAGKPPEDIVRELKARDMEWVDVDTLHHLDPGVVEFHAEGRLTEFFAGVSFGDLTQISVPVLVLRANPALGGIMPDGDANTLQTQIPDVTYRYFADADHGLGFSQGVEAPAVQEMLAFLARLRTA